MPCTSYTNDLESDNMNIKCTFNGKKAWENAVDLLQHRSMEVHGNLKQAAYEEVNYRLCLALIHMEFSPVVWSNITKQEQSENLMKQRLLPQNRTQNWLSVSAEESGLSKWFAWCMSAALELILNLLLVDPGLVVYQIAQIYQTRSISTIISD